LGSTGTYTFEPEILELVPSGKDFDIGSQLFAQLVALKLPFFVQYRPLNWNDISRVSDYWSVLQRVLRGEIAKRSRPGREA
jgi:mannose-1-phosphate guanylyltransferase